MAVTARAAKTNFAIWALLHQLLPPLTDGNLQGMEAPRSEALHTTMARARLRAGVAGKQHRTRAAGQGRWPAQLDQSRRAALRPAGRGVNARRSISASECVRRRASDAWPDPLPQHNRERLDARPAAGRRQAPATTGTGKAPSPRESAGGRFGKKTSHMLRSAERVPLPRPVPVPH